MYTRFGSLCGDTCDRLDTYDPIYHVVTFRFSDYCLSKIYKLGYIIDSKQSTTGLLSSHVRAIKTIKG